jgi:hypothetical protein
MSDRWLEVGQVDKQYALRLGGIFTLNSVYLSVISLVHSYK